MLHNIGRIIKEVDVASSNSKICQPISDGVQLDEECAQGEGKGKRKDIGMMEDRQVRVAAELPETSALKNQVATKNNNVPVEVTNWDIWTVNNFVPPEAAYSKSLEECKIMFKEEPKGKSPSVQIRIS